MSEALLPLFDAIASAAPLVIAGLVSGALAAVHRWFGEVVPKRFYPILLPTAGAFLAAIAKMAGVDVGDFNPETADLTMWQTVAAGAASGWIAIGMHQVRKQWVKGPDKPANPIPR